MSYALNDKQELFCQEYVKDWNATQAALRSGYSEHTAKDIGAENLSKPSIRARIDELKAELIRDCKIDSRYVLERLRDIDQMDVADIFTDDMILKPLSQWPKVWRQSLTALEVAELWEGRGDDKRMMGVLKKIKWVDKVKNLELLGRHKAVAAFEKEEASPAAAMAEAFAKLIDRLPN